MAPSFESQARTVEMSDPLNHDRISAVMEKYISLSNYSWLTLDERDGFEVDLMESLSSASAEDLARLVCQLVLPEAIKRVQRERQTREHAKKQEVVAKQRAYDDRVARDPKFRDSEEQRKIKRNSKDRIAWDAKHGEGSWQAVQDRLAARDKEAKVRAEAFRQSQEVKEAERLAYSAKAFRDAMDNLRQCVIDEWTEELLEQRFQNKSGDFVSWGEASVQEHQDRHDLLVEHGSKAMSIATRHASAIELIRQRGMSNLAESVA